eukprot:15365412-Ditylum_brightwellii.AAC.1
MVRQHRRSKNFAKTGSFKSIESLGAADIAQQMIDGKMNILLNEIMIDDDAATMKAIQRKEDGGLLWHKQQVTSIQEIYKTRMAPLLHHFGNHNMGTPKCPAWQATERNEVYVLQKKFLCHKMHSDIFEDVAAVLSRFTAMECLKEILHKGFTQRNEGVNNSNNNKASKKRVYSSIVVSWTG